MESNFITTIILFVFKVIRCNQAILEIYRNIVFQWCWSTNSGVDNSCLVNVHLYAFQRPGWQAKVFTALYVLSKMLTVSEPGDRPFCSFSSFYLGYGGFILISHNKPSSKFKYIYIYVSIYIEYMYCAQKTARCCHCDWPFLSSLAKVALES